ncbi:MAG: glycosyltransferase [Prevotella sp.]|nr:glycosyltransferase [Prevotella sp.]
MKHILIFNDSMQFGGTEVLLVNILKHLTDSGSPCKITLLLPAPNDADLLLDEVPDSVEVKYIYRQKLPRFKKVFYENLMSFFPSLFLKMVHLDLNKYDLLLCFKDGLYSVIFPHCQRPTILWVHNLPVKRDFHVASLKEYIPVQMQRARVYRFLRSFLSYSQVVFVSHATMHNYIKLYYNGKQKKQDLRVIYNAIDFSRIGKLSMEPLQWDMEPHPVFVMAVRFSIEKGIDRVVTAAKRLKDEGYKFKVVIMGDGPFFEDIKGQIEKYALADEISLKGYVANPYPCIKAADWLICSSEKESFSLVVVESICLGTPVIATDCGGPTEISDNGKYALLTENSSEGIYTGMKKALDNPALANNYTSLADECLRRFNYDKWLDDATKILLP